MDDENREDLRAAYQVAASAWTYEGETLWSKFNAFLVANSLTFAAQGFSLSILPPWLISLLGLAMCAAWFFVVNRSFDQYNYWIASLREYEYLLGGGVQTLRRGRDFAEGREVSFTSASKEPETLQCSRSGARFRIRQVCNFVILCFTAVYISGLAVSIVAANRAEEVAHVPLASVEDAPAPRQKPTPDQAH